ncbi:hypothetical protein GUR47_16000 [Streptomyces tendae]|uniref:Uncharacterized protein n=2 Tax=Streptomyces tendae TaxID=1932 RepID=A0A6B3QP95_STRTE|nr:hypothetical protein [Streptomyces tendae]
MSTPVLARSTRLTRQAFHFRHDVGRDTADHMVVVRVVLPPPFPGHRE